MSPVARLKSIWSIVEDSSGRARCSGDRALRTDRLQRLARSSEATIDDSDSGMNTEEVTRRSRQDLDRPPKVLGVSAVPVDVEARPTPIRSGAVPSVLRWLLPRGLALNGQERRQAHFVLGLCAAAIVVEPLFALRHLFANHAPGAAYATFGLCVLAALIPLLMRRGLSPAIGVQIICSAVVVAGACVCVSRGGFIVTALMAHVFLPLAGVMLDRRSVALRWAAVGAANLTLVAGAARLGMVGLAPASSAEYPQLLFFLACSTVLTLAYDHSRRELEAERARLQQQAAGAQRLESLGYLAAGVAHDFNNLLTVFGASSAAMLDELPPNDALRADAMAMQEGVTRGIAITARLLSFARQEQRQLSVFDVRETVLQMESMFRRALPPNVHISLAIGKERAYTSGDPCELEQVLLNLVVNARDAMPSGGQLHVSTRFERSTPPTKGGGPAHPPNYIVSVRDSGTGIPESVLEHIFEPFFTTKARGVGTGLGLATAYGVVRAMGGDIRVTSSREAGSCFEVFLPEAKPTVGAAAALDRAVEPPRAESPLPPPPPSAATPPPEARAGRELLTILLVDDQEIVRRSTVVGRHFGG